MATRYEHARVGVKALLFRRGRLLLLRRRDDLALHPGVWDLPGGGVEAGGDLEPTLIREVREETGLTVRVGPPVHVNLHVARLTSGHRIRGVVAFYLVTASGNAAPRLDRSEHVAYRWVRSGEVPEPGVVPRQAEAIRRAFALRRRRPRRRRR